MKSGEEQWIGLQNIFALTNQTPKKSELRIVLESFANVTKEAYYETFFLENEVFLASQGPTAKCFIEKEWRL